MAILYELLIHADDRVDYDYLCSHFEVCQKTMRKDIQSINDDLNTQGIQITYKKSSGYMLQASNSKAMEELKQQFEYRFIDANDVESKLDTRVNSILFYFLEKDRYVKLEELSEFMHLNQRTISTIIKSVHKVLEGYRIKLAIKPHYGMRLEGREMDIRYCYTDAVCFYSSDSTTNIFADSISNLSMDTNEKEKVTKICLEYINLTGCPLSQIAIRKMIILIMITHKREMHGHKVVFTAEQTKILEGYALHLNVPWLFRQLNQLYQCKESSSEFNLIKLFILSNLDYSEEKYKIPLPSEIQKTIRKYSLDVIEMLISYGVVSEKNKKTFLESLLPVLSRISVRSAFNVVENNPNSYLRKAVNNSPISVTLGLLCMHVIQKSSGQYFGSNTYIDLCLAMYSCIRMTRNISKMNRLAIFTPADRASGISLKRRIMDRYSNIIQSIDIVTTADLIKKGIADYNYLVLFEKEEPFGLHDTIPCLHVDYFFNELDVRQFYELIANPSRIYRRAFGELQQSDYNLHYRCNEIEDVLSDIRNCTSDKLILKQLSDFEMNIHLISNSTLNLIFFTKIKKNTFSKLLVLNHLIDYEGSKFNRIFVHAIAIESDMIKLKTSEKVTRNLTMIEDTMDMVLKVPFIDFYDYYVLLKKTTI